MLRSWWQGHKGWKSRARRKVQRRWRADGMQGWQHGREIHWQYNWQKKNQDIIQRRRRKERWRKYQTDNVGQREVIENIWVRSYQNSLRESMKNEKNEIKSRSRMKCWCFLMSGELQRDLRYFPLPSLAHSQVIWCDCTVALLHSTLLSLQGTLVS